jgi:3-phenylpropionate/trans-cinnamate dioxygenase ferredoxin subunit
MSETKNFVKVAALTEVPEGLAHVYEVGGKKIAVCHSADGVYAIDDRCTHDNGPLGEGELVDGEIECPRHGARFDIKTGKALCLPAVGAVATYSVEVRDGEIWIGLPNSK